MVRTQKFKKNGKYRVQNCTQNCIKNCVKKQTRMVDGKSRLITSKQMYQAMTFRLKPIAYLADRAKYDRLYDVNSRQIIANTCNKKCATKCSKSRSN